MTRRQFRAVWLRRHKRYERKGLAVFRKKLRQTLLKLPFDNLETWNYKTILDVNVNEKEINNAYLQLYYYIGLDNGKRMGKSINKQVKEFNPANFESSYFDFVRNWLLNNAGYKITSVKDELVQYVIQFIAKGMEDNKDMRTISRELHKHILSRGFYRWQIERIVRTETTAAANLGSIQAGNSSGVIWEKRWISTNDSRTRRRPEDRYDHFEMDGVKVMKGEKFNVQGDMVEFPGDPKGQPGNVINCRCAVVVVARRDSQGKIIFTD